MRGELPSRLPQHRQCSTSAVGLTASFVPSWSQPDAVVEDSSALRHALVG
ncbi:hypothetical protein [Cryptosporangium sp. NPDC048952]